MQERIETVQAIDVERAADLAGTYPDSDSRDLLHAAVMQRPGLRRIISADAGFVRLPDVERLDPAKFLSWRPLVVS